MENIFLINKPELLLVSPAIGLTINWLKCVGRGREVKPCTQDFCVEKENLLLSRPAEILLETLFHQWLSSEGMFSRICRFLFLPKRFVGHHD